MAKYTNLPTYLPSLQKNMKTSFVSKTNAPIIILFCRRRNRINFYSQHKNVSDITSDQFKVVGEEVDCEESAQVNHSYIYINESLTPENCRLLKAARLESKKQK